MIVANCLQRICSKSITYKNAFPPRNQAFLSQRQVKYAADIIVTRDMANLGMSRREAIQAILDTVQASSYAQEKNHLDYLIWENRLTNMKRCGRVIKSQSTNTER